MALENSDKKTTRLAAENQSKNGSWSRPRTSCVLDDREINQLDNKRVRAS